MSTRPSIGRHDPLHPPAVAAVEPFLCQVLGERVSDISGRAIGPWLHSNAAQQGLSAIRVIGSPRKPLLQGAATVGGTAGEAGRLSWRVPFM